MKTEVNSATFRGFASLITFVSALVAVPALAAENLLVNPSFEANSGRVIPSGWTRYAPTNAQPAGNYWIESVVPAQSGKQYWKQWGASYDAILSSVAGIYQDFSSSPGSVYQASAWFYTRGSDVMGSECSAWVDVLFFDAATNVIAVYKTEDFTAASGTDTWLQYPVALACDPTKPIPSGDPEFTRYSVTGSVAQITAPVGTKAVRYRYAYLQSKTQGGSAYLDTTDLTQVSGPQPPTITGLSPRNMIFVNPNDGLRFTATSPSGFNIPTSGIELVLNGANVSSQLVITGTSSNRTVSFPGLQSNMTYAASIKVTDALGFSASTSTSFETTWVGVPPIIYIWEAEDWDFESGKYINNPELCNAAGNPNCYFGKVGVEGVDEHFMGGTGNHYYRPDDPIPTGIAGDLLRKNLDEAGRSDYRIDPFIGAEWLNYTRDWPAGTYWALARVATGEGLSGSLTLSQVNPDSSVTDLGVFTVDSGRGWSSYDNVLLRDTNGNIANITLTGKATLRVTSGGNLLPNFFMLAAGQVDLPIVSKLSPSGATPFQATNALTFTVATAGSTFPANGITVSLDGADISSSLQFSGTDSIRNVLYPSLQSNATHVAVINATNALGHGVSVTNRFDTFAQSNFTVEAEDFDFDRGQFLSDTVPNSYAGLGAVTNVDYQHTFVEGEKFPYRPEGIPQEIARDFLRDSFVTWGATDYQLAWFAAADWANYTRVFPTNQYQVFVRSGGFGDYTMSLDRVTAGAGTVTQSLTPLGEFKGTGKDNQTHEWVALTVANQTTPAVVSLGSTNTLRLSTRTGNCHPTYLMFVPAAVSAQVQVSIGRQGNAAVMSFPTRTGVSYTIQGRNSLTSGTWSTVTTLVGDGTVKTFSEPATESQKFYRVVGQ